MNATCSWSRRALRRPFRSARSTIPRSNRRGQAIDLVLKAHEPNPALAYDRHWNLVTANRMVAALLEGIPPHLLGQPLNILRLAFHPEGLAPRTVNLAEWSAHLLERLHRQCEATADPELLKLYQELKAYRMPARSGPLSADNVAIPFKLRRNDEVLSFISTTMVFGTPVDITLQELALETFFPGRRSYRRADAADRGEPAVGWVERSDTHHLEAGEVDGFRFALPILHPSGLYRRAPFA